MYAKLLLAYSEATSCKYNHCKIAEIPLCTPKIFWCIRLKTFGVFSGYDQSHLAYYQNTYKELVKG